MNLLYPGSWNSIFLFFINYVNMTDVYVTEPDVIQCLHCIYPYMYVVNHAWTYICVCGDINTHITHMYLSMYVYAYMLNQCTHLGIYIGRPT